MINMLHVYIPGPVPETRYTCTCTVVQVYTCVQISLTQETHPKQPQRQEANGRHDITPNITLCTYSAHITCNPKPRFRCELT